MNSWPTFREFITEEVPKERIAPVLSAQEQPGGTAHPGGFIDGLCMHKVERESRGGAWGIGPGLCKILHANFRENKL